jgi:hypothetical protein
MCACVQEEPCSRSVSEKGRDTPERVGATSERGEGAPKRGSPPVQAAGGPRGFGGRNRRRKLWGEGWGDGGLGEKGETGKRGGKERNVDLLRWGDYPAWFTVQSGLGKMSSGASAGETGDV